MKLLDAMIVWNRPGERPRQRLGARPLADDLPLVKVGPHGSVGGRWHEPWRNADGAAWVRDWPRSSDDERLLRLFVLFASLTIREGIPAADVHRAFLEIDEYREALPLDVPGSMSEAEREERAADSTLHP